MSKLKTNVLIIIFVFALSLVVLAQDNKFSFVVFGDNHDNYEVFGQLINKVNQEPDLDFVVSTGDFLTYGKIGQKTQYEKYLKTIKKFKVPLYQTMGNHDGAGSGYQYFSQYFGPYYYSFDHENAHFIVLNNAFKVSFDKGQKAWLKADLAKNVNKPIFVFMHKPALDPTDSVFENYIMPGRQETQELIGLFNRYKVDYVIAGHIHGFARTKRDAVVYLLVGGAGGPLHLPREIGGFFHYVKFIVNGDKIKDEVKMIYE